MPTHRVIYRHGWFVPQYRWLLWWFDFECGMLDCGGHWTERVLCTTQDEAWKHVQTYGSR